MMMMMMNISMIDFQQQQQILLRKYHGSISVFLLFKIRMMNGCMCVKMESKILKFVKILKKIHEMKC